MYTTRVKNSKCMPPRPISYSTTDRMKRDEERGWRKGEETRYAGEMKEEKEGDIERERER